jgi:hypothetical protein
MTATSVQRKGDLSSPPQCAKCARLADAQRKLKKHQALLDRLNLGVLPRIMQEAAE